VEQQLGGFLLPGERVERDAVVQDHRAERPAAARPQDVQRERVAAVAGEDAHVLLHELRDG
jgi:hypothetical protein